MNKQQLFENIKRKKSFLCVGLDTRHQKIPEHLLKKTRSSPSVKPSYSDNRPCIAYKLISLSAEVLGVERLDYF